MKKNIMNPLLFGALALTGLFLSCSKEPIAQEEKATPVVETGNKEVSAQFVLSVATGEGKTRQSAAAVQKDNNFLGIQDTKIFAYATGVEGAPYVNSTTTPAKKQFDLGVLYSSGQITAADNQTSSSNRVLQLSIPLSTDAMLFYGKAINEQPGRIQGKMEANISATASETYFDLCSRIGDRLTSYNRTAALMIYVFNRLMDAEVDALSEGEDYLGYTNLPAINWQQIGQQYEINNELYGRTGVKVQQDPLEENLAKMFSMLTYIKQGEYRAGSSHAIKSMVASLNKLVSATDSASPTTAAEANAHRLAEELTARIADYFTSSGEFQATATIKNRVVNSLHLMSESDWNGRFSGAADLNDFPYGDFGVPDGVAQLAFNDTDLFSYKIPNSSLITPNNPTAVFQPDHYMYPAELMYYVNSPLRVTDKDDLSVSDYPNGVGPWSDDTSAGNKWAVGLWQKNGKVKSSTRGVAIRDNINYGVSLFETNVAWGNGVSSLKDNRSAMTGGEEEDRVFSVNDAHFSLHGVLIGGQNPRMGWQFLKRGADGDHAAFDYVIYDDHIASSGVPTVSPNYTVVFDNYDSSVESQNDVYVALEFENGGDAFWGRDNLIPNGALFYLTARLQNANGGSITWPTDYQVPPIYGVDGETVPDGKVAGASKQIPRIFIQDFLTKATFRIGETSLHNAFMTIPDLRTTQMSLGLSVDLEWRSGYEFDLEL